MGETPQDGPTSGDMQDLAVAVEQLTEETRLLRMALDELRDDVVWAARQVLASGYQASGTPPPVPCDPLAPDRPSESLTAASQRIAETDESAEGILYCCEQPKLTWNGDPDAPGVACERCGYVIAEQGNVVIWREEDDHSNSTTVTTPGSDDRQGRLF